MPPKPLLLFLGALLLLAVVASILARSSDAADLVGFAFSFVLYTLVAYALLGLIPELATWKRVTGSLVLPLVAAAGCSMLLLGANPVTGGLSGIYLYAAPGLRVSQGIRSAIAGAQERLFSPRAVDPRSSDFVGLARPGDVGVFVYGLVARPSGELALSWGASSRGRTVHRITPIHPDGTLGADLQFPPGSAPELPVLLSVAPEGALLAEAGRNREASDHVVLFDAGGTTASTLHPRAPGRRLTPLRAAPDGRLAALFRGDSGGLSLVAYQPGTEAPAGAPRDLGWLPLRGEQGDRDVLLPVDLFFWPGGDLGIVARRLPLDEQGGPRSGERGEDATLVLRVAGEADRVTVIELQARNWHHGGTMEDGTQLFYPALEANVFEGSWRQREPLLLLDAGPAARQVLLQRREFKPDASEAPWPEALPRLGIQGIDDPHEIDAAAVYPGNRIALLSRPNYDAEGRLWLLDRQGRVVSSVVLQGAMRP